MSTIMHVTGKEFENEVLKSEVPVLVDFAAVWCGPCQMMGPVMDQLAGEFAEKAKIIKVDIDQAQDLAVKYKVMSVPTMMFFKGGKMVEQSVGAVPKKILADKLSGLV